jgi:hypothetical protein
MHDQKTRPKAAPRLSMELLDETAYILFRDSFWQNRGPTVEQRNETAVIAHPGIPKANRNKREISFRWLVAAFSPFAVSS